MTNLKKTREQLQFDITCNNRLCTSVESIERFEVFHFATYNKFFSDKKEGFIYSKMNKNGSWSFRHFANHNEAIDYMNGISIAQMKLNRK